MGSSIHATSRSFKGVIRELKLDAFHMEPQISRHKLISSLMEVVPRPQQHLAQVSVPVSCVQ